jgi:alpha-amylase
VERNPYKAVTFVTNHDTDEIYNKQLAYAYILTHEGYPTLFYKDYEEWLDKEKMNNLIWIHNQKATGTTSILYTDNDEYIARRNGYNGNPGLVVYINNSSVWQERWVPTNWNNAQIKDFTGNSTYNTKRYVGENTMSSKRLFRLVNQHVNSIHYKNEAVLKDSPFFYSHL